MQTEQLNDVCRLKYTILFHVIEKSVTKMTNANKDISPQSLNTLIMYREPSDYASPIHPLCLSIDAATSTFSPPLSDHTLEGHPFLSTAATKSACTVAARLFVEQLK